MLGAMYRGDTTTDSPGRRVKPADPGGSSLVGNHHRKKPSRRISVRLGRTRRLVRNLRQDGTPIRLCTVTDHKYPARTILMQGLLDLSMLADLNN